MKGLCTIALLASLVTPAIADDVPTKAGQCVETTITEITSRLDGAPDSGDAVVYANGIYGVSYYVVDGLRQSQVGDKVKLCLDALPEGCPTGDERGNIYTTTNLRNQATWTLSDAEHMCGGA